MPQSDHAAQPQTLEVRVGRVATRGDHATAYAKQPVDGPVHAGPLGLSGDEVGDRAHHGGLDKAVYAYAADHYGWWRGHRPAHANRLVPGAFGENLVVAGLTEDGLCVGDRWRVGTALLQPCQPRRPCATMARWFDDPAMVRAFHRAGRSGWYCRVLQPGLIAAGDAWVLEHRPAGAWTFRRLVDATATRPIAPAAARAARALDGLAGEWRAWIDGG